jgi:hypothetical protein
METVMLGLAIGRRVAARMGPYVAVELLLPGGTLLALLLYWYRRRAGTQKNTSRGLSI